MRPIARRRLSRDPRVLLVTRLYPLAILLIGLEHVRKHANPSHFGDEWRYLWYAKNLLHGYFTPRDNEMIWNGPGYPLALAPFLAFGTPEHALKLLNAVLLAGAVWYVHRTLLFYCSPLRAMAGGLVLGLSPLAYQTLALLYTETFALFAMAGAVYHFCAARRADGGRDAIYAGFFVGVLALTKVSFGPLVLACLLVAGGFWLAQRRTRFVARSLVTFGIAFALCIPWLAYTRSISGKPFYWASGSGLLIYWMTTPYPDELGDGLHHGHVKNVPWLYERHGRFFESLIGDLNEVKDTELERALPGLGRLGGVKADEEFWRVARAQLAAHPGAYARKWCFNVSRLFFDYPYTRKYVVDGRLVALHVVLLGLLGFVLVQRVRGRLHLSVQLEVIGIVALVATGLATGLGAGVRYLLPLYPPYVLLALAGTAPERRREAIEA
jgi:4-amino-4-deoxy-L-arabinose transferase-like glycosyltransferase